VVRFKLVDGTIISIDSDLPEKWGLMQIEPESQELREQISLWSGLRGISLDDKSNCPVDLEAGLLIEKIPFEVIEGAEILDLPLEELPPGAVW
jgi:hypothetical protein